MKRPIWLLLAAVILAALFSGTSAVGDEEEAGAHAESTCSQGSTFALAIIPEIGLSFEAEIMPASTTRGPAGGGASASVNVRERWSIKFIYNDIVILDMIGRERADGILQRRKVMGNLEGADHLEMQALSQDTGETCWGTLQAEL